MPAPVGAGDTAEAKRSPPVGIIGDDQLTQRLQPRPMLGRLPWLALERRSLALRFLVFLDIGVQGYRPRPATTHAT